MGELAFMETVGLHPVLLLAGFLGSLAYIAAQPGPPASWWAVYSPIVTGTLTANYIPAWLVGYFFGSAAIHSFGSGCSSFAVGGCGPLGIRYLITRASRALNGNSQQPSGKA